MPREYMFFDEFKSRRPEWQVRGAEPWSGSEKAKGDERAVEWHDGFVRLKVIPDPDNPGQWLEGHIGTGEIGGPQRFSFTYGWVEFEARVQLFHGAHCSGWLQGVDGYVPGQAEIDVFEHFGAHNPARKTGVFMYQNLYWRQFDDEPVRQCIRKTLNDPPVPWGDDFHSFKLHWSPKRYTFFIDDEPTSVVDVGLSAKPKFLVLSMLTRDFEMPYLNEHVLPQMDVRSVKVWRMK